MVVTFSIFVSRIDERLGILLTGYSQTLVMRKELTGRLSFDVV